MTETPAGSLLSSLDLAGSGCSEESSAEAKESSSFSSGGLIGPRTCSSPTSITGLGIDQGICKVSNGGVISLASTSSQRACVKAGRRASLPTKAAINAKTQATTALLKPISTRSCTARPFQSASGGREPPVRFPCQPRGALAPGSPAQYP